MCLQDVHLGMEMGKLFGKKNIRNRIPGEVAVEEVEGVVVKRGGADRAALLRRGRPPLLPGCGRWWRSRAAL